MANNLYLVLEENRGLITMRVSWQTHAAGEAFYVHRRLRPPRDRPKPFQSFPDKTGVHVGIGEEVVKSIFTWSFNLN